MSLSPIVSPQEREAARDYHNLLANDQRANRGSHEP